MINTIADYIAAHLIAGTLDSVAVSDQGDALLYTIAYHVIDGDTRDGKIKSYLIDKVAV